MNLYDSPVKEQSWYFVKPKRLSIPYNLLLSMGRRSLQLLYLQEVVSIFI